MWQVIYWKPLRLTYSWIDCFLDDGAIWDSLGDCGGSPSESNLLIGSYADFVREYVNE